MIEGLGYIRLAVTQLERAIAFYRDGLRFSYLGAADGPPASVRLQVGDFQLALIESVDAAPRGLGLCVCVDVKGVDAYHDALVARGLEPTAPVDADRGRTFTIADPDGYRWCFRQSLD